MDQAVRILPPKSLSTLVGLTLKLDSLCITVSVVENIWTFWCCVNLERFVLVDNGRNVKILWEICRGEGNLVEIARNIVGGH